MSEDTGGVEPKDGLTGVSGTVSAANSLVGASANDQEGVSGVYKLSNGNYMVPNPNWDNGLMADAGAMTWGAAHGWDGPSFRVYYLGGALLTAPLLGVGSLLLWGRRWAAPAGLLYAGLAVGVALAMPVHGSFGDTIPAAQDHLGWLPRIVAIAGNSLGTLAIVVVAVASFRRRPVGNALILAAVGVAALGSSLAGTGVAATSAFVAAAAILLYLGVAGVPPILRFRATFAEGVETSCEAAGAETGLVLVVSGCSADVRGATPRSSLSRPSTSALGEIAYNSCARPCLSSGAPTCVNSAAYAASRPATASKKARDAVICPGAAKSMIRLAALTPSPTKLGRASRSIASLTAPR